MNKKLFTLLTTVRVEYDAFRSNYKALKEHPFAKDKQLRQRVEAEIAENSASDDLLKAYEGYKQLNKACEITAKLTLKTLSDLYPMLCYPGTNTPMIDTRQFVGLQNFPTGKANLEKRIKNEQPSPEKITELYISFVGSRSFARYISDCRLLRGESESYSESLDKFLDIPPQGNYAERPLIIEHIQK